MLKSERSAFERGSFRLVSQSSFRSLFHIMKLLFDRKNVLVNSSINTAGEGLFRESYFLLLCCSTPLKNCSTLHSSSTVTLNPLGSEKA